MFLIFFVCHRYLHFMSSCHYDAQGELICEPESFYQAPYVDSSFQSLLQPSVAPPLAPNATPGQPAPGGGLPETEDIADSDWYARYDPSEASDPQAYMLLKR